MEIVNKKYKQGTQLAGIGFLVAFMGYFFDILFQLGGNYEYISTATYIVGVVIFFFGCYHMATGKGYHDSFALLGLLSFIGLIILFVIPNRTKKDQ